MSQRWSGTVAGLALIGLGLAFLAQNYFAIPLFHNWWALFILIPAFGALAAARQQWQRGETYSAGGSLATALVLGAVLAIFLSDMPWRLSWPALLVAAGIGLLLPSLARRGA